MGTFMGHVLPGSFLLFFSIWHAVQTSLAYFRSRSRNGRFRSSSYFAPPCCCGGIPIESILKVFVTTVGIIGEAVTGMKDGHFVHLGNLQHITMFFFFGITGVVEMLHHYKFHLPPNMVYVSYIQAFVIEGVLFYWHLHGRANMDKQVHILLLYVIAATVVTLFVELYNRNHVLPALIRVYFVVLQGVWFWQVAFILYPPHGFSEWNLENHEQMMIVTVIFCVDAGLTLVAMMAIWFAVACHFNKCRISSTDRHGRLRLDEYRPLASHSSKSRGSKINGLMKARTLDDDEIELYPASPDDRSKTQAIIEAGSQSDSDV